MLLLFRCGSAAVLRCLRTTMRITQIPFILVVILAIALKTGAKLTPCELEYREDEDAIIGFDAGAKVKIPGLIAAFTAHEWIKVRSNATSGNSSYSRFSCQFALSESNRTNGKLEVELSLEKLNIFYCSVLLNRPSPFVSLWRAPCKPAPIPRRENNASCALVLTAAGDLQLLDISSNNHTILWHSGTDGIGNSSLAIDDLTSLSLVRTADNKTVWGSTQNFTAGYDPNCLQFNVSAGNVSAGVSVGNLSRGLKVLNLPGGGRCFLFSVLASLTGAALLLL
ncbi:hypothetical protein R1flu_013356 [Riccia fluitans]|uniref:Bulb-type lectin domain-containing protein n=1 Tax=Riccia fluitans TaxID=41844 RepID=A0ABD1YDB5_9MARC